MRKLATSTAIAVVIFIVLFFMFGCSDAVKIKLSVETIELCVGESRDIAPYVVFSPSTAPDRKLKVETDGDCVSVRGTVVSALSAGEADIKISSAGNSVTVKVTVGYRDATAFYISLSGALVQTVSSHDTARHVLFSASVDEFADPSVEVEWRVNGTVAGSGPTFDFTPDGFGEFEVEATAFGLSDRRTVKIYRESEARGDYVGDLVQDDGNFSAVKFTAHETVDTRNPISDVSWFVNGEKLGVGAQFEFTPRTQGEYKVTLEVNGVARKISGRESVVVKASGIPVLRGRVQFDDVRGVRIAFDGCEYLTRVTLFAPDGTRRDIERSDAQHEYRFGRGYFDADELIRVCADDPSYYTIRLIAESACEFTFMQYPTEAREYIEKAVLLNDCFICDRADAAAFIKELALCEIATARCYIGRDADGAVEVMEATAIELGAIADIVVDGNIAKVTLNNGYVAAPKRYAKFVYAQRMYSMLPHIEYDASKRRSRSYVLALDRVRESVEVETSEQLLYAVKNGVRPIPVEGSTAALIYGGTRSKLLSIIGAGYDAFDKVRAIYDWLQWVTVAETGGGTDSCGRFLEGVFGSAQLPAPDGADGRGAVTSEGAAKAFALMCGMEGIDCDIIVVDSSYGPRYVNRLQIDGARYNVDIFGGKIRSYEIGITSNVELTSHRAFMRSDAQMTALGYDMSGFPSDRIAFCDTRSEFMRKRTYNGTYFDYYIDVKEKDDYNAVSAAVAYAFSDWRREISVPPVIGANATQVNYSAGVEFELDRSLTQAEFIGAKALIVRAVKENVRIFFGKVIEDADIKIYGTGNIVHVSTTVARGDDRRGYGEA